MEWEANKNDYIVPLPTFEIVKCSLRNSASSQSVYRVSLNLVVDKAGSHQACNIAVVQWHMSNQSVTDYYTMSLALVRAITNPLE